MKNFAHSFILLGLMPLVMTGCASTTTTNTARAAKEQLLISNAVDRALNKVNFAPLAGQRIFIDEKYLDCVDKPYVMGSIRHRVAREGGRIAAKAEDADIIVEPRSGVIGTDMQNKFVGVPEITLPGLLTLPEIKVATNEAQQGFAKIGIAVLDAKTGTLLGDGGVSIANSNDNNWYVMGVGPFQNGTIMQEIQDASTRQVGQPYRPLPSVVSMDSPSSGGIRHASTDDVEAGDNPYQFTAGEEFK